VKHILLHISGSWPIGVRLVHPWAERDPCRFSEKREPSRFSLCQTQSFCHMGGLRLVGSLKLQVSVAKEPYKRDDILQKRPLILRSLLIVATPYSVAILSQNEKREAISLLIWPYSVILPDSVAILSQNEKRDISLQPCDILFDRISQG